MKQTNSLFKKAMLVLCVMVVCCIPASADVLTGDVDRDGSVGVGDVAALIDYLLVQDGSQVIAAADFNGDGEATIVDLSRLVDFMLLMPMVADTHEWVDLGLPSGTLWATCNVGADSPEEYGDYFAWGETVPKQYYHWSTYKWCNGEANSMTKYCCKSDDGDYGVDGFIDDIIVLELEDDAACVKWGPSWRIPTRKQQLELLHQCTCQWTERNGVKGALFTGPNGNTMFMPAAGYLWFGSLYAEGLDGIYWSRSLYTPSPYGAYCMSFDSNGQCGGSFYERSAGLTVRAVRVSPY